LPGCLRDAVGDETRRRWWCAHVEGQGAPDAERAGRVGGGGHARRRADMAMASGRALRGLDRHHAARRVQEVQRAAGVAGVEAGDQSSR